MGKGKGPHVEKRLTPAMVKKAAPGRHTDGGGLYLVVDPSGARRWVARLTLKGKRRDFGIGPVQTIGLAEARERAAEYRRLAYLGMDPRLERAKGAGSISFKEAAKRVHEDLVLSHGRNGKHKKQWLSTLETYAFPKLGNMDVAHIKSSDVVDVLSPIWGKTHETARRVKQRIGVVMDWCISKNFRAADNPVGAVPRGLKRVKKVENHFAAVSWLDAPDVWAKIQEKADGLRRDEVVGLMALQFAILTVSRSGPVRMATWDQLDASKADWATAPHWHIPAAHMKAEQAFDIPLALATQTHLATWREMAPKTELIFPSPYNPNKPLSDATMRKALQSLAPGTTVHGWRSTFTDWLAERTDMGPEMGSVTLAHGRPKTDAAYRRTQYFDKRIVIMEAWSRYLLDGQCYYVTVQELKDEAEARHEAMLEIMAARNDRGEFD